MFCAGAQADDSACMRINCLGKCVSRAEMEGKAIPALCMRQAQCYNDVECTVLADGKCGWKETPEMKACLADRRNGMPFNSDSD